MSAGRHGELCTFQDVFDEHGSQAFRMEILETCTPMQLRERKVYYLNLPNGSELNLDRWKASRGGERQRERFEWLTISEIAKLQWLIPSMRAKMTAGIREAQGRPEVKAKMRASQPKKSISAEQRRKMVAGQQTPEARARMSEAHKGVPLSPEHRARINDALRRPETRAKFSAAGKGRKHTPEALAKIGAASRALWATPEARAKLRATWQGRKHTPEARAKMAFAAKARWAERAAKAKLKLESVQEQRVRWKPSPAHQAKLDAANQRRQHEAARRRLQQTSPDPTG